MKMRRRNCYADVITKAEGETDRPHYGSCINVNQLLLTFSFFLLSLNKKDGPRDFLADRRTVFLSHLMANCAYFLFDFE